MLKRLIPATVVLAALVAACAGTGSTPAPTVPPVTPAAVTAAPPSASPVTLAYTVALAPAGFFVGSNGHSLYAFDKDTAGTSNCQTDQCAGNWPALTLQGGVQLAIGAGLQESDFATITRTDGTAQVTFNDVPLYYFVGDTAIGDTNGDGVGGIWHLATKATVPPTPSSAPSASATVPASAPASLGTGDQICYDPYHTVVPCPSGSPAASGTTVSASSAGYLVNTAGITLYEYDKDTTKNSSACTGDCATNWPALTVAAGGSVTAGSGVDQEDFATFTRSDDSTSQVTYYGKPLYTFAGDSAPGDTNGSGISPDWHVAKPQ